MAKSENKTKPAKVSVTAFINGVENDTRRRDAKAVLAMMKKITGEKPKIWGPSIIGFGEYHYKYASGREGNMLLVDFPRVKPTWCSMCSVRLPKMTRSAKKLGKFKTGRSCLYINKLEDVDLKVLEKLIEKSYKTTKKNWNA